MDAAVVGEGPAPTIVAPVPVAVVDAGVADAGVKSKQRVARSGTGTGTGAPPAPAGAGAGVAMPTCEKIIALYCTDEFKATEGSMAGELCRNMSKVLATWKALPDPAAQEDWCKQSWPNMSGAVAERLRMFREGLGPGQKPPP